MALSITLGAVVFLPLVFISGRPAVRPPGGTVPCRGNRGPPPAAGDTPVRLGVRSFSQVTSPVRPISQDPGHLEPLELEKTTGYLDFLEKTTGHSSRIEKTAGQYQVAPHVRPARTRRIPIPVKAGNPAALRAATGRTNAASTGLRATRRCRPRGTGHRVTGHGQEPHSCGPSPPEGRPSVPPPRTVPRARGLPEARRKDGGRVRGDAPPPAPGRSGWSLDPAVAVASR